MSGPAKMCAHTHAHTTICVYDVYAVLTPHAESPASTGTWHDWPLLPPHSALSWEQK